MVTGASAAAPWRTLRSPRCRQNPRTTRARPPRGLILTDSPQGSPSSHVRQPQRSPPQDPGRADRSRPRVRGGRRRRDARGPPRAARGGRQLQGRQGLRRPRARARARRGDPREPDRRPAGREDRQRGADGAPVGGRPDLPPRRQPGGHRARRPPGLGQDDDRRPSSRSTSSSSGARRCSSPRIPTGRPPRTSSRRSARASASPSTARPSGRRRVDIARAGHRAREAHRPRHGDHRHGRAGSRSTTR